MRMRAGLLIAALMVATSTTRAWADPSPFVLTADDIQPSPWDGGGVPPNPLNTPNTAPPPASASCAYSDRLTAAAEARGLDPGLLIAVAQTETRCRHLGQRSRKGAIGLMQLMPATARRFGATNPWDIDQNIAAGASYLAWLSERYGGDVRRVVAAYNAGEGAVDAHRGVPPFAETRAYVRRIEASLATAEPVPPIARARVEQPFVLELPAPDGDILSDAIE